nr:hypothetical protein [Bacteroidales bacterium]
LDGSLGKYVLGFSSVYTEENYDFVILQGNEDDNIAVTKDGTYTITLAIDNENTGQKTILIEPQEVDTLLSGWYVAGNGMALESISELGMLRPSQEEVSQTMRESLLHTYMALEEGGTFNIINIKQNQQQLYGPGPDFKLVTPEELIDSEPTGFLYKGTIEENAGVFTAVEAGLYHIIYDTELGVCAIAKADFGIVGDATPGGWETDTRLNPTFGMDEMTFSIDSLQLRGGNHYKFRYNDGWRIYLQKDSALGDIAINTNLGGYFGMLTEGGNNILNEEDGGYSISLTWELGEDFTFNIINTSGTPDIEWDTIRWEAVGEAISTINLLSEPDPHWNWGERLWADQEGLAQYYSSDELNYIYYSWENITLEANKGFKLRTAKLDGSLGKYVLGFSSVYTEENYDYVILQSNEDDNIAVTKDGVYTITLAIDNENTGQKTILIEPQEVDTVDQNLDSIRWDIVGTAISPTNLFSEPDPYWNWGQRLWASQHLIVVDEFSDDINGNVYSWTEITLQAYEGFKLRSVNPDNSLGNDILGFSSVYTEENDTLLQMDGEGDNIAVTQNGVYTITLAIDGHTDETEIYIELLEENGSGSGTDTIMPPDTTITPPDTIIQKDWSTTTWDMSGDISTSNPGIVEDNLWDWGFRLWADDNGLPTHSEDLYIWTWSNINIDASVEESNSFRLREVIENSWTNANLGYNAVVQEYSNNVIETNTNIAVSESNSYDIALTIDTEDHMDIIITIASPDTTSLGDTTIIPILF